MYSERQCSEVEGVADGDVMGFADYEHHLSQSALEYDAKDLAAMVESGGQMYEDAIMDDLRARVKALGEDVDGLYERVRDESAVGRGNRETA